MSSHRWYPEGYHHPPSADAGPQHPAYIQKLSRPLGDHGSSLPPRSRPAQGTRSSGTRRSSLSSQSHNNSSASVSTPEQLARIAGVSDPGLVAGIDYFKIGETVRVRRLTALGTHTDWAYGQVTRPHLRQYRPTEPERVYFVSYVDPRTGLQKENEFSCYRKEIAPLLDCRGTPLPVFALLPQKLSQRPAQIWTAAYVVNNSDFGVNVRVASGPATHFQNIQSIVPYNSPVASSTGQIVAKNGRTHD